LSDSKRHHIGVCQSGVTYTEAFDLIRSLVEVIRLVPENGELKVELRGELAGILACAAQTQKSRTTMIRLLLHDN
jgi:hypothetical protein